MRRETPTAPTADIDEVAHAVQGMQSALDALAAALKQQKQKPAAPPQGTKVSEVEAKPAADGPTEPPPTNKVEQRIAKTPSDSAEPPRSHNSASRNRRPPPPTWDFSELKDDCLLREYEVAQVGRWSQNSVAAWRSIPDHPLKWTHIAGGQVRYRVGDLRKFLVGVKRTRRPGAALLQPRTAENRRKALAKSQADEAERAPQPQTDDLAVLQPK